MGPARGHRLTGKISWWIPACAALACSFIFALLFYLAHLYGILNNFFDGVAGNAVAGFIDVAVVVVLLGAFEQLRNRNETIARHRERIEEVKKFDDLRGHSILGAAIRSLAKYKLTDIDLRGIELSNFSFQRHDISSIEGSVISDGIHMIGNLRNFSKLRSVDFTWVNCNRVCFGKGGLSLTELDDCRFWAASLVGASFESVRLRWSADEVKIDEKDWYEHEKDIDGNPNSVQIYNPAFEGADLTDCSFRNAFFRNCDFRRARNIDKAHFEGACGLETCHFDEGEGPLIS